MPQPLTKYSLDQYIVYPLVDKFSYEFMNPNVITTLNIIPSLICLYFLATKNYTLFLLFLIMRTIFDCFDGHVARKFNKTSKFGRYYDAILDLVFYNLAIIIIFWDSLLIDKFIVIALIFIIMETNNIITFPIYKLIVDNTIISVPILFMLLIQISDCV